jgi:hypothetical protein
MQGVCGTRSKAYVAHVIRKNGVPPKFDRLHSPTLATRGASAARLCSETAERSRAALVPGRRMQSALILVARKALCGGHSLSWRCHRCRLPGSASLGRR